MSSLTTPEAELRALGSLRRQCLFAVTILLVEDSRTASEAIRLYAAESGARVRRADSLHAASRHLAIYRPSVVMVDLGLPDGDGMALIRHLASASTPIDAIIALSGHERAAWQAEATLAGAAACLEKPIASLQGVPGMRARGAARCREPPPARRARADAGRAGVGRRGASRGPAPRPGAARRRGSRRGCRDHRLLRAVPRLGRRDARRSRPLCCRARRGGARRRGAAGGAARPAARRGAARSRRWPDA